MSIQKTYQVIYDDEAILAVSIYTEIPLVLKKRTFEITYKGRVVNYMLIDATTEDEAIEEFKDFSGLPF